MSGRPGLQTAAELKRHFDEAFSRPVEFNEDSTEGVLAIVAAGVRVAVRTKDIRSIHLCPKVTRVPSSAPTCAGVATVRGKPVGVYDLALLLGHSSLIASGRWILLVGDRSIGLAFDELVGFRRLSENAIRRVVGTDEGEQLVQLGDTSYAFADVSALVRRIENVTGDDAD